jgi:hypothetical protein
MANFPLDYLTALVADVFPTEIRKTEFLQVGVNCAAARKALSDWHFCKTLEP